MWGTDKVPVRLGAPWSLGDISRNPGDGAVWPLYWVLSWSLSWRGEAGSLGSNTCRSVLVSFSFSSQLDVRSPFYSMTQCTCAHLIQELYKIVLEKQNKIVLYFYMRCALFYFWKCWSSTLDRLTTLWIVIQSFQPGSFPTFVLFRPSCQGNSFGVRREEMEASMSSRLVYRHEIKRRGLTLRLDTHGRIWAELRIGPLWIGLQHGTS